MKAVDWKPIFRKYKGLWVALKHGESNEVVASAKTLRRVLKEAEKSGFPKATVMRIPEEILIHGLSAQLRA